MPDESRTILSRKDKTLSATPVAILLLVAVVGTFRIETRDQSPWFGGAFGMFSTVFQPLVRAYLETPGGDIPIAFDPVHDALPGRSWTALAAYGADPSTSSANEYAAFLARQQWVPEDYGHVSRGLTPSARSVRIIEPEDPVPERSQLVSFTGVRVVVERVDLNLHQGTLFTTVVSRGHADR